MKRLFKFLFIPALAVVLLSPYVGPVVAPLHDMAGEKIAEMRADQPE